MAHATRKQFRELIYGCRVYVRDERERERASLVESVAGEEKRDRGRRESGSTTVSQTETYSSLAFAVLLELEFSLFFSCFSVLDVGSLRASGIVEESSTPHREVDSPISPLSTVVMGTILGFDSRLPDQFCARV